MPQVTWSYLMLWTPSEIKILRLSYLWTFFITLTLTRALDYNELLFKFQYSRYLLILVRNLWVGIFLPVSVYNYNYQALTILWKLFLWKRTSLFLDLSWSHVSLTFHSFNFYWLVQSWTCASNFLDK